MKRTLCLAFLIALCFLLQTTLFEAISLGGICPDLMLILVTSFGILSGKREGLWIGFFSGLLIDIFFGRYLGMYALLYMYAGYISGLFSRRFYPDDFLIPVLLTAANDLFCNIIVYAALFFSKGQTDVFYYLKSIILPEAIYTLIIAIPVYLVFVRLNALLNSAGIKGADNFD